MPTPTNTIPLHEEGGRGSLVFFTEATMFQSAAIKEHTMKQAVRNGHSGNVDFEAELARGFKPAQPALIPSTSKVNKLA